MYPALYSHVLTTPALSLSVPIHTSHPLSNFSLSLSLSATVCTNHICAVPSLVVVVHIVSPETPFCIECST
jgi:hypothetical protein